MDLAVSVTLTWSKQEKTKDVAETEESEEYHPTNRKRLLALFCVILTAQNLSYNIISYHILFIEEEELWSLNHGITDFANRKTQKFIPWFGFFSLKSKRDHFKKMGAKMLKKM